MTAKFMIQIYILSVLLFFPLGFLTGYLYTDEELNRLKGVQEELGLCRRDVARADDILNNCVGFQARVAWEMDYLSKKITFLIQALR